MSRAAGMLVFLLLTGSSPAALAGPAAVPSPVNGMVGTLACRLSDAVAAYAMFGSPNPLLCDFKPTGGFVATRLPMRIVAQVEGAPTERGTVAVWKVIGAGADPAKLAGEYALDQDGQLANGKMTLVPADDALVPDAMATMPPAPPGARNVAIWIAEMRL
ncbi:hypothetical protein ACVIGB_000946 [Bradyrhizobium sp. USDA 4341]